MYSRRRQPFAPAIAIAALVVVALLLGIWWGGHPGDLPGFLRNGFVSGQDTRVVNEAIDDVAHDYYRRVSPSTLANSSISGLVASLHDRFSNYLTPHEFQVFDQPGSFSGIGVVVTPDTSGLRIVRIFDQSPAQRSGLKVNDLITAVDSRPLRGVPSDASTRLIEGAPGTDVTLTIRRHGVFRRVRITREVVSEPVVSSQMRTYHGLHLGVVELAMFTLGAHGQVRQAVDQELSHGAKGLVLDLRQNGGGLVEEAQLIASIFIPKGVIVTTRGRSQPTSTLTATGGAISSKIPVVVLVDSDTASASEIVTGALQDHHRALVVGTHTFGKGVFQEVLPLSNGGALDITVGQYFTPNGHNLGGNGVSQGAGISPNVPVPASQVDTDSGVQAALRTLASQIR